MKALMHEIQAAIDEAAKGNVDECVRDATSGRPGSLR